MLIARYWSKAEADAENRHGKPMRVQCWRGSATSVSEAQSLARDAVERIVARIRSGAGFPERYSYGERPLREEVLEEMRSPDDTLEAAITRNVYGAKVLNAARAAFVDVDVPPPGPLATLLNRLMRRGTDPRLDAALAKLREWCNTHPEWDVRVYRTHSGLRYLVTHAPLVPEDRATEDVMRSLGVDPQYVHLYRAQKSFRARLTPKPWRCGIPLPAERFPWADRTVERRARAWQASYDQASASFSTCASFEVLGNRRVDPAIAPVVDVHDEATRVSSGLPLA